MAKATMGYTQMATNDGVEILFNSGYIAKAVTLDTSAFGEEGVCLAGTPISEAGAIANDGTAVGILLKDVYGTRPQATVVYQGAIREAVAEAHCKLTYADTMKAALKNVVFM